MKIDMKASVVIWEWGSSTGIPAMTCRSKARLACGDKEGWKMDAKHAVEINKIFKILFFKQNLFNLLCVVRSRHVINYDVKTRSVAGDSPGDAPQSSNCRRYARHIIYRLHCSLHDCSTLTKYVISL